MTPRLPVERIERLFVDAMSSETFERLGSRRGVWDVSRDCETPVPVVMHSRATGSIRRALHGGQVHGMELTLLTPCRRCQTCLRKKARLWRDRALAEIHASPRTWFGTLTLRPDVHVWIDRLAATRCANFWERTERQKFGARAEVVGIETTKFLKRVRKNAGAQYRYLLVVETHDGPETSEAYRMWPHMHMLVHEVPGEPQITKRVLERAWHHGFSQWRLTRDDEAAWYVSKYLTKASEERTRASLGYGSSTARPFRERLK